MSYTLHVWESPTVSTVADASAVVLAIQGQIVQNPRFLAFAKSLTAAYPDMDSMEAQGRNIEDSVWSDSPLDGKTDRPVYVIGVVVDQLNDELVQFIAHTAADHGLQVYDNQAGRLYCTDRSVVDDTGHRRPVPRPALQNRETLKPVFSFSSSQATHYLIKKFGARVAQDGWQIEFEQKNKLNGYVWRQHGDIKQAISINAYIFEKRAVIYVNFRFHAREIQQTIGKLQPEIVQLLKQWNMGLVRDKGAKHLWDLSASILDLYMQPDCKSLGAVDFLDGCEVDSQDALEIWPDLFYQWFLANATGKLAGARGLASLGAMLDTPWHRQCTRLHLRDVRELYGRVILMYLARSPNLQDWFTYARDISNIKIEYLKETPAEKLKPEDVADREWWPLLNKLTKLGKDSELALRPANHNTLVTPQPEKKSTSKRRWVYQALGVLAGLVFVYAGFSQRSELTQAKAIGKAAIVQPVVSYTTHKSFYNKLYTAEISFTTETGKLITVKHSFPEEVLKDFQSGQPVTILYNPSSPTEIVFEKERPSWFMVIGGTVIALTAIIFL